MPSRMYQSNWRITNEAGKWQAEHFRTGQIIGPCQSKQQIQDVIDNFEEEPEKEDPDNIPAEEAEEEYLL